MNIQLSFNQLFIIWLQNDLFKYFIILYFLKCLISKANLMKKSHYLSIQGGWHDDASEF